ncbi:hypothetical protein N9594_00755, partial [bacterium]|nr:hypothetical protein [bacterium]
GAGVEDTIERLIGHELDHSDHEKESKKDFAPALVTLQAERAPFEEEALHVRGCNQQDEGGTAPLLEVVFKPLLDL